MILALMMFQSQGLCQSLMCRFVRIAMSTITNMNLDFRQKRILREMAEREEIKEGYRDRNLDLTTDPERTKIPYKVSEVAYDDGYNKMITSNLLLWE